MMYRQGDVMVVSTDSIPEGTEDVPLDKGRIVLAYGEVTGHAHAINSPFAALVEKGAERFLKIERSVELRHEEHSKIELPPGMYKVVRQREYSPEELRYVAD
jgi:hypothetical protein